MTLACRRDASASADHVAIGPRPDVLDQVRSEEINLAVWERSLHPALDRAIAGLDISALQDIRIVATPDEVPAAIEAAARGVIQGDGLTALTHDIGDLARRFADIMAIGTVEIRLERIVGNACYKYHSDYVSIRLITTYLGLGTEWLGGDELARLDAGAVLDRLVPRRLDRGDVGLFKGRSATSRPIIHRSPPIAGTGAQRLLLVINPPPTDDLVHPA
ncbi:DUF1826 domain-containing protein [Sphingomonas bacterium]|uniref:DUF1826 domain-containing protein n=1 Tax=Sphingomonas bacterium TaxID=1895847 RepID=UPI001575E05B|nr:DUF1826 domain-containing protein [Sphingomonas bacterium]